MFPFYLRSITVPLCVNKKSDTKSWHFNLIPNVLYKFFSCDTSPKKENSLSRLQKNRKLKKSPELLSLSHSLDFDSCQNNDYVVHCEFKERERSKHTMEKFFVSSLSSLDERRQHVRKLLVGRSLLFGCFAFVTTAECSGWKFEVFARYI